MKVKNQKAFTLAEILIASALSLIVIIEVISIYVMLERSWREGAAQLAVQREAQIVLEKIMYGNQVSISGTLYRAGLIEADEVYTPDIVDSDLPTPDNTIYFRLIVDNAGKWRSFFLSNGKIYYDPDISIGNNEVIIGPSSSDITATTLEFRKGDGIGEYGSNSRVGVRVNMQQVISIGTVPLTINATVQSNIRIRN